MIVMRLSDGLGNQLFQFAASEELRARTGARIGFLADAFYPRRVNADRPLLLPDLIACREQLLPERSVRARRDVLIHRLLGPQDDKVRHIPRLCHLTRRPGDDAQFDRIGDGMLVSGYFQANRLVDRVLPAVRAAIGARFGTRVVEARAGLRARHGDRRLVALHVRLGDYRRIGDGAEAIVPRERIRAAVAQVVPHAVVVAFSDTPEGLAPLDVGRPIEPYRGASVLDDFAGMIACDDFIIANSTFSWWASTLADAPGKTVWAPRDWRRPGRPDSDPDNDIYRPEHRLY